DYYCMLYMGSGILF
nr:immunoglobulin light chain junction region [Macaca mulatta]MOW56517.1 immunoglobulin light chain junction region [Macaca mulatta]MOW56768.1 immunoglobulin light chain junction region [Macaca mulatta]MOW56825.1 immunoglobulin light chain junction region [Macaca mulatta]MOW56923.1 immunoglobulin light chain junction region [Macaca mulatta]